MFIIRNKEKYLKVFTSVSFAIYWILILVGTDSHFSVWNYPLNKLLYAVWFCFAFSLVFHIPDFTYALGFVTWFYQLFMPYSCYGQHESYLLQNRNINTIFVIYPSLPFSQSSPKVSCCIYMQFKSWWLRNILKFRHTAG